MPACIQGTFEIAHIGILLRVDSRIWEENREIAAHVSQWSCTCAITDSIKNFILSVLEVQNEPRCANVKTVVRLMLELVPVIQMALNLCDNV